ncbi:GRP family sugar transporter [Actinospica sp.]|jgi:glucose uptake protein|uniref:GRP family sugar transporter n=1 Tax=Actinospica sp. TaxID=1872142 RepID=UPI002B91C0E9|nr:GRP family sugar transporter [Actinospica sp.]HWG26470.1 GRP family sugar transporter [Actinospica sp.]
MTTLLLSLVIVLSWGSWIPIAQSIPGAKQSTRTFYITAGNLVFATVALLAGGSGGQIGLGWREFWLPLAGGMVWTAGSFCAFRATETIGLARSAGTWTPLNIIVAFAFGAVLFSELKGTSAARYAILGGCLVLVLAGVFLIIGSQDTSSASSTSGTVTSGRLAPAPPRAHSVGFSYAIGAGILWGGYFVPAQWAHVSSQLANFPLGIGMFVAAAALAARDGGIVKLPPRHMSALFAAGLLFGIGSVALLGLVSRVGTGVGFTIAQLSLLPTAGVGIWIFKVPEPGTPAAKKAVAGILLAGVSGTIIGAVR